MSLKSIRDKLGEGTKLSQSFGCVTKVSSTNVEADGISVGIGDIVVIKGDHQDILGMVTEATRAMFSISPFGFTDGLKVGDRVYKNSHGLSIPVGEGLLGRVVDPFMNPIDGKGPISFSGKELIMKPPLNVLERGLIDEVFSVGVKSIDGLLTCGKGQKLGIFAGSGVGKSTLLSMIVRGSEAPIKVIALIGERGREVPEFIQKNLGGDLTNTVIIVATSDDSPLMRKYGAFSAMSVAEYFKDRNKDVLFMMDSVTRFAMAQREIGLALGEPPTSKGYPPSVLTILPQLMERAGKEQNGGSITAFFTVLVEGDDMSDPIADQSRSILDGHIVLSRELTDFGIYPPVQIMNSASRVMNDIITPQHLQAVARYKRMYALLKENEMLLRIGAYKKGTDPAIDEAVAKKETIENFLKQDVGQLKSFNEIVQELQAI
ncbi:MAG: flagellar protein export ATPase FliI [Campylobacterota bacterium]